MQCHDIASTLMRTTLYKCHMPAGLRIAPILEVIRERPFDFFMVEGCGVGWERERTGKFCEIKKKKNRTLFCPQEKKKKKS